MTVELQTLKRQNSALSDAAEQIKILEQSDSIPFFPDKLAQNGWSDFRSSRVEIFQMNLGKFCNQTCAHCHVDAGPDRREIMSRAVMEDCLSALERSDIPTVDITGGAPELNPDFRWLIESIRSLGRHVIDRCNLTVLETIPHQDLPTFFARHNVEIVCSLPYFQARETDRQRGAGVFEKSIAALKELNKIGYGQPDSGLILNLVYNPVGAFLPGSQKSMESEFKRHLFRKHEVVFNQLYCITNMPISRFLGFLLSSGNYEHYMQKLVNAFNPSAVAQVMCRNTISIGWDGSLYDCDFNQMLELPVTFEAPQTVRTFDIQRLENRPIVTGRHCFGCTAGSGSSCGGALSTKAEREK